MSKGRYRRLSKQAGRNERAAGFSPRGLSQLGETAQAEACGSNGNAEQPRLHGSAVVVATACVQGEQTQHGRPIPVVSGGEVKTSMREVPTGRPPGTTAWGDYGRAGVGVGQAHSTGEAGWSTGFAGEEAGNDRGGKGPELKGQRRKQRGRKESGDESG